MDHGADDELRKQARNCLSYLFPNVETESKTIRTQRRIELAGSIINVEGLAVTDSLHLRDTKLKLWKTAARIMSMATKEEDKITMLKDHALVCNNAYLLQGTRESLAGSAFAAAMPGPEDTYRFWECDKIGRVKEKTIGPEGLSDRLGLEVTRVEELRRARPCPQATSITQLDELTGWIVDQPDGTFVPHATHGEAEDWSPECRMDAQQFRDIFRFGGSRIVPKLETKARTQLRSGSLNHEMLRNTPNDRNTKYGSYEKMASQQVGRILMADESQHATVKKLMEQRSDWDHAILVSCEYTEERGSNRAIRTRPDLANSKWFFPTKPERHPVRQLYDAVTVENGDIVETTEVTAGRMRRDLSQAVIMTSAESVEDDDDEDEEEGVVGGNQVPARGGSSKGGPSKRRRMTYGEIDSDGGE
jgi:hypothetical protein